MSDASPQNSPVDQLDEELVAYLDGELESQAAQRLENLLATDERARQRLNQLAVSWDLLDQLPRATVDDLFTRSTVEMVAVAAEDEIAQTSSTAPARNRRRWLAGGVAALLAAAVGFVAIGLVMPDHNDPLLRNLPVVVNLDLYRSVGDVELLKKLEASNLFPAVEVDSAPRPASSGDAAPAAATTPQPINVPASINQRRALIATLSLDRKLELNRDLEKFIALSPDEKQALRGIDDYLQANPEQADNWTRLMQRYHDWLKSLTPAQRADLSDTTTPETHLAEIKKIKLEQEGRLFLRLGGGRGGPRDIDHVLRWMQDFAAQHEKDILEALPEDEQQELKKLAQRGGSERMGPRFYQRRLALELFRPNSPVKMPDITAADLQPLLAQLSPEKQAELKTADDAAQRVEVLRTWIRAALADAAQQRSRFASQGAWRMGGGPDSDRRAHFEEELNHFADTLPAEEKARLANLPDDQRRAELMKLLQKQHSARHGRSIQRPHGDSPPGASAGKDDPGPREYPPTDRPDDDMDQPPPPSSP